MLHQNSHQLLASVVWDDSQLKWCRINSTTGQSFSLLFVYNGESWILDPEEDNILAIWHLHLGCKVNKCFTEDIIVQILMYKRSPTCTVYWWSIKVCSLLLNSAIDWFGFWSSLSKSLCISCRVSLCLSHFLPVVLGVFLSIWSRLFTSEIALPLRISCIMLYYIIIRIHN